MLCFSLSVCALKKKEIIWDIQLEHRDKHREHLFKGDWSHPPSVRLTPVPRSRYITKTSSFILTLLWHCNVGLNGAQANRRYKELARVLSLFQKCINLKVRHDVMCSTNIVPCLERDLQCRFAPVSSPYSSANLETKGSSASSFFLLTPPSHLVWLNL